MIEALQFVRGAFATKDFVAALTHFRITGGAILGYNGAMALSSPIDIAMTCNPRASPFIKAVYLCREVVSLGLTKAGRLAVRSGDFEAFIDCLPEAESYPEIRPEGENLQIGGGEIFAAFAAVVDLISEDASRPWSCGVLLSSREYGVTACATNNIIFVERYVGAFQTPTICIPGDAVREVVRIGTPPERIQASERSVTFHYPGGRWLRSQLLPNEWPDPTRLFEREGTPVATHPSLYDGLKRLSPFLGENGTCYFTGDRITTEVGEDSGASVSVPGIPPTGAWHLKQLLKLEGVAQEIDFGMWPDPCPFRGEMLRGVICGKIL